VFGRPRDLVTQAAKRLCRAIEANQPAEPVKYILMSSVSVNRPGRLDTRRGSFERAVFAAMRGVVPPARDNQSAADFLGNEIGPDNPFVEWTVVRPDTLLEGDISKYALHEGLVSSLAKPDSTNMANVAHFICELATDPAIFADWKGRMPVIVNSGTIAT
jgi:hypothetical protein